MNFRRFLILIGLVGFGILLLINLGSINDFAKYLTQIHWYLVPLLILAQIASYYANARFYDAFFVLSGYHVPILRLFKVALGINFTNQAIPAGGIAGATYLSRTLKDSVPPGKATLSQIAKYIFSFLTNIPLLALGMLIIFFSGSISHISVRLILLIVTVALTLGVAAISFLSERSRMRRVVSPLIRAYNRVGSFFFRKHFQALTPAQISLFFDEFYSGYRTVMSTKRSWLNLSLWAMLSNIAEIATVYITFIGFNVWPNLGVVIMGYQIAIAASLIGPFTAGAGALEFGMVGAFTALGEPLALSLAVVVVYRFLNMLLFLPPGFYFYRQDLLK